MIRTELGNHEGFLDMLRDLFGRLRGLQITLYVDVAGWYKGRPVREFLRTHPLLQLQYLPAYQLAFNRQERTWRRVRYEATTNCWFATLDDIWDSVQRTGLGHPGSSNDFVTLLDASVLSGR